MTDSGLPPILVDAKDAGSINMIMGIARVLSGMVRTEDVEYYTLGQRYVCGEKAVIISRGSNGYDVTYSCDLRLSRWMPYPRVISVLFITWNSCN